MTQSSIKQRNSPEMASARSIQHSQEVGRDHWKQAASARPVNVGETERLASKVGGGVLLFAGLLKGGIKGLALTGLGAAFLYRGVTGHCHLYQTLGADSSEGSKGPYGSVGAQRGVRVEESIVIARPANEIYEFWRNHSNLPQFMEGMEAVDSPDGILSYWTYQGPFGTTLRWSAEIHGDEPGKMIAWRSLPTSEIDTAGSVHFSPVFGGRGTEVRVNQKFDPPGGKIGIGIARLLGNDPATQTRQNLLNLKRILETRNLPTAQAQSTGKA
jgi:uncharacterized membrane protein